MRIVLSMAQVRTALAICAVMFAVAKYIVLLGFNQELLFDKLEESNLRFDRRITYLEQKFDKEAEAYAQLKLLAKQNQLKPTQLEGLKWPTPTKIFH